MIVSNKEIEQKRESFPLNELLGISKGDFLIFLKSYYDESFSHHMANPNLLFVGGCTLSSQDWLYLESQWNLVLNNFGISIFRSSDCNSSKGEFSGWDGHKKDKLRGCLIRTIRQSWGAHRGSSICAVFSAIGLDRSIFARVASEFPLAKISPYELCVLLCVSGNIAAAAGMEIYTIGIFFEEGQDVRPHIRKILRENQKLEPRIVDISFVDKASHMPLQVADMIAFEAFKSHCEGKRKVFEDLFGVGTGKVLFYSEEDIRKFFVNNHEFLVL